MYEVRITVQFCANHQVPLPNGTLEPLHGHHWEAEAVFRGERVDADGILVDFATAENALRQVVAPLEHVVLNGSPFMAGLNPTAELVAKRIFEELAELVGDAAVLAAVYVREAPGCVAGYTVERLQS